MNNLTNNLRIKTLKLSSVFCRLNLVHEAMNINTKLQFFFGIYIDVFENIVRKFKNH